MSTEAAALIEGALVARTKVHLEAHNTYSGAGAGYYAPGTRLPDDLARESVEEFVKHGSAEIVPGPALPAWEGPTLTHEQLAQLAEVAGFRMHMRLEKYNDREEGDSEARAADPDVAPDDVIESDHNTLTIGGASSLWEFSLGNGTATAAQPLTYFNTTVASLGVGDSTTAAADTQTNLQASTNKTYKGPDASFPSHTDSTSVSGAKSITYKSTFGTSDANYAWQEWGVFNATTPGRMLNRKVESLGTKTSSATWTLTITLSLA